MISTCTAIPLEATVLPRPVKVAGVWPVSETATLNFGIGDQLAAMLEQMQETPPEEVNGEAVEILETMQNVTPSVTQDDAIEENASVINE